MTVKGASGETVQFDTTGQPGQNGTVKVTSDKGTTTAESGKNTVTSKDVGVDFYPGATVEVGANVTASGEKPGKAKMVSLVTGDKFDQVAKFYQDKYAKGNAVLAQPNMLMITVKTGDKSGKMIMVSPKDDKTAIVITDAAGG